MSSADLLRFKTSVSSICATGDGIDVMKKSLQNYLRRREASKMKWCLNQIHKFSQFNTDSEKKTSQAIMTNLRNRFIIMLDEEVLFSEWDVYLKCRALISEFEKNVLNVSPLHIVCDLMCESKMLRVNSDIYCFYGLSVNEKNPHLVIYKEKYSLTDVLNWFKLGIENMNLDAIFYWALYLFENPYEVELCIKIFKRSEPVYLIWRYILESKRVKECVNLNACLEYRLKEFFNKNRIEKKLFLISAINLFIYSERLDFSKDWMSVVPKEISVPIEVMTLDDYVLSDKFLVINEDKEYLNEKWRDFYVEVTNEQIQKENEKMLRLAEKNVVNLEKKAEKLEKKAEKAVLNKKKKYISAEKKVEMLEKKLAKMDRELEQEMKLLESLEYIPMNLMKFVGLCRDTISNRKVMCFIVEYMGSRYVLKEGRKSLNYNEEYCVVDEIKSIFGLQSIGMRRILSDKVMVKVDKTKKTWGKELLGKDLESSDGISKEINWQWIPANNVVYTMMRYIPSITFNDAIKVGKVGKKEELEYMKIGLFRGILGVLNFNVTNVLVSEVDNSLISISEKQINENRESIVGRMNMRYYKKHKDEIESIFVNLEENKEEKKAQIKSILDQYGYEKYVEFVFANYDGIKAKYYAEIGSK